MHNQSLQLHTPAPTFGSDTIQSNIQLMTRVVQIQLLDKNLKEHKLLVSYEGHGGLYPEYWSDFTVAEELNAALTGFCKANTERNIVAYKSNAYTLINGIYQKTINWVPQIIAGDAVQPLI